MPTTETLSDGSSAVVRTAAEVPERRRRAHLAAQSQMLEASGFKMSEDGKADVSGFNPGVVRYQGAVNDTLILCHVASWSREEELNEETLQDLPSGIYDELLAFANKNSKGLILEVTPADAKDPASPTEPLAE